jgi:hypothetical protein
MGKSGYTDGEAFDCFVFGSATSTVGATDGFGVSTTMFVTTVISTRRQCVCLEVNGMMIPSFESHDCNDDSKNELEITCGFKSQPETICGWDCCRTVPEP